MKAEIRDMWAEALESGEYAQGRERLTRVAENGTELDCCLGVLCKLAVKEGVIPAPVLSETKSGERILRYGAGGASDLLPPEVSEWAGLEDNSVGLTHQDREHTADYLNDIRELTFPQIAALIREQL